MQTYRFHAKDEIGKTVMGELAAENVTQLYALLAAKNLFCTQYRIKNTTVSGRKKTKYRTLAIMNRQLSTMLSAGVALVDALDILAKTSASHKTKLMYQDLSERVRKGYSLSSSLNQSLVSFPPLQIYMVQSGEKSGTLDEVMERLAIYFEKEHKMMNKVTSAMMYPMILLVVTLVVVIGLMAFILPTFFSMFEGLALPWNTKLLIWFSNFIIHQGWLVALVLVALVPIAHTFFKQPVVSVVVDRWKLNIPVFGKLNRVVLTSRFARTFSSLFGSGIGVIESLTIVSDVLVNTYVQEKLTMAIENIKQGEYLSKTIEDLHIFDELLNSMLYVGEESGNLENILLTVADFYDEEADNAIQKMIALIEPIMIVILALIIGFVLISVIVPIYNSFGTIQ